MSELFMVVSLRATKGKEEELRRDLIAVVEPSRKDEGNLRYELFGDEDNPGHFVFVEHWASPEAQHKHHTQGAHIQHFNAHGAKNVEAVDSVLKLNRIA